LRKTPAIPPDLDTQVFTARFAKRPKQIDVVRLPVRIAKIPVGEAVGFGNTLHDFLRSRDDVSRGEEPRCGSPPLASKANDRFLWKRTFDEAVRSEMCRKRTLTAPRRRVTSIRIDHFAAARNEALCQRSQCTIFDGHEPDGRRRRRCLDRQDLDVHSLTAKAHDASGDKTKPTARFDQTQVKMERD
jgi:hypothetical protein